MQLKHQATEIKKGIHMALIQVQLDNGIATVTLNRPDKKNAMSFALLQALHSTAKQLRKNRDLRAVILTGQNQVFSTGIDLHDLNNPKNSLYAAWQLLKPGQSLFQKAFLVWQDLPVPVIAALEGYCLGAGMQLALAADIRIAHPDTQLSIMESRWGLVPDMGISQTLKGLVPLDVAKELTYAARMFNASEAKSLGLISHVADAPYAKAQQLAQEFASRSPDALLAAKRVLNSMTQDSPRHALRLEKIWQLKLLLGKNSRVARAKDQHTALQFKPRQFD